MDHRRSGRPVQRAAWHPRLVAIRLELAAFDGRISGPRGRWLTTRGGTLVAESTADYRRTQSGVLRVSQAYVAAKEADPDASVEDHHFLGAVVYESKVPLAGDVTRHDVIDGQQRLTTLQLRVDAVHEVVLARDHRDMAESVEELILNGSPRFAGKRERFKLWPSQADRQAFGYSMHRIAV